ncbi:MAG: CinA family nicotinamide mononucleotide deamidase-related protein [Muribaculaceae bacterium]|nr:CinA family nicotinamide mononucleotide deamidase-related protein [Muribaculaceae bacterium]
MRLSIIVIGDEILIGQVTDTNSGAVARMFGPMGWTVRNIYTIGDGYDEIFETVNRAMDESDLVITTGGLGPTKDDITKGVMTDIFGGELIHDPAVTENIHEMFSKRGLKMNPLTEAQAMVPSSCRVVQNRFGTAPVMWFERGGKVLVSMPGVPFETEGMLPEVARLVKERFHADETLLHHSLMVAGITESALAQHLADFEDSLGQGLHLAYLPTPGLIRLRLDGRGTDGSGIELRFDEAVNRLKSRLGDLMIYDGDATAAEILLRKLADRKLTVATAESCTGGNIAHRLTSIPGSSESFLGGVVSYANEVKSGVLGVNPADIEAHGAVSREVVEQMAVGACRATGARCSMATSGIAGPGGGSDEKPVGTVWMAWAVDGHVESRVFHFPGNRSRVIDRATTEALLGLLAMIK